MPSPRSTSFAWRGGSQARSYWLPISNYDPISTWDKILRIGIELVDRSFPGMEETVAKALFETMELMGHQQKVEYYSSKQLTKPSEELRIEDQLRLMLVHYHDLYDGEYKVGLSFFHLVCDVLVGTFNPKKGFEEYLRDDVSHKTKRIKEMSGSLKTIHGLEWLVFGADIHIRNAVAHKNWRFTENTVVLWDKDGWEQTFGILELDDILRSLTIAIIALEASLIIALTKHQRQIIPYVKGKEYDLESINTIMYHNAQDQGFVLDDVVISRKGFLKCELIDKPQPHGPSELIMRDGPVSVKTVIPPVAARSERALSFVYDSLSVLHGYNEVEVELMNYRKDQRGILRVNVMRWMEIGAKPKPLKSEYDREVTRTNVIDD